MASIHDVAKLANVGTTTVSRVINKNGYVSKETLEKVNKAIEELNYSPNQLGKNLRSRKSYLVALFVPTIFHPFFSKLAYYVESELYHKGYKMLLVNSQDEPDKEVKLMKMIHSGQVEGIIYVTHYNERINFKSLPVVTLDRHIDGVPCITSDNYNASKKALYYLRKVGCKNIGFIGGKSSTPTEVEERYKAYLDFCKETDNPKTVSYNELKHGEELMVSKLFLDKNRTLDGIFCSSDLLTNACYIKLIENGKKVPEDVKIIGYDGALNELVPEPVFTVVKQRIDLIAKELVRTLLLRIDEEEVEEIEYISSEFVLGDTA